MENFLNSFSTFNSNNNAFDGLDLDINKILVILLLLTGKFQIESITVYPNDFAITLGTFKIL